MGLLGSVFLLLAVLTISLLLYLGYLYKSYQNRSKESPDTLFTLDKARDIGDEFLKPKKIFFLHGWPDDRSLFEKQAKALADTGKYDCYRLEIPNFTRESFVKNKSNIWGWDFRTVGTSIALCITSKLKFGEKVILVCHDWGSVFGRNIVEQSEGTVEACIMMDVGDGPPRNLSLQHRLMLLGYQFINVLALLAPLSSIGEMIMDFNARQIVKYKYPPTLAVDKREPFSPFRGYLYLNVFIMMYQAMKTGRAPRLGLPLTDPDAFCNLKPDHCRILYLFGTRKPFMFQTVQFLEKLKANDQLVKPLDCGHWVMYHKDFDQILQEFLDDHESKRGDY